MTKTLKRERLLEITSNRQAMGIDRAAGIIRRVKILGFESANGRTYTRQAVARARPMYEGAKVNVNHPRGRGDESRSYEDRIGVLRNVTVGDGGLYADFHFNPKHKLAEQLLWDAEHSPENVGFSHNAEGGTRRSGGKVVVEEITHVHSVDLVADPATNKSLFEADMVAAHSPGMGKQTAADDFQTGINSKVVDVFNDPQLTTKQKLKKFEYLLQIRDEMAGDEEDDAGGSPPPTKYDPYGQPMDDQTIADDVQKNVKESIRRLRGASPMPSIKTLQERAAWLRR